MMRTPASGAEANRRVQAGRFALAVAAFAVGVFAPVVVPFLFIRLVADAQEACFHVTGGQAFFLMVTWFELVIAGWVLFGIGALVARRRSLIARLASGLALVLALCLVATWQLVPWGPSTDYGTPGVGQCGPGGVPTWWSPVLPHH